uniref:Transducin family protein / WD-40 repeat family protein n=1 Tax=Arundo donax TaxID=35708 RepID=A0A0A9E4Y2_ARUDO
MIPLQRERHKAALHLVPPPSPDAAVVPAAEEQRLLWIGVEPDVIGGAAVRLHDANGVEQCGGVRLGGCCGGGGDA